MRIVLASADADSEAVRELLVAWSSAGLLRPFSWWPLADTTSGQLAVQTVTAGKTTEQPLWEAVRDVRQADIELVCLRATSAAHAGEDAAFAADVHARLEAAKTVIAPSGEHPLEPTMIVVPAAIGQEVDLDLFRAEWAANVYVAPEDRHDPGAPNALVENAGDFAPHAAHALATLADLWQTSGVSEPVLPAVRRGDFGSQTVPVHVARCFTRAVDFGYLPGQLAARVFRAGDGWPNPDDDRFDRTTDVRSIIEHLAPRFSAKHREAIGLSELEPPIPLLEPEELGILEAIKRLVRQWKTWLLNRPYDIGRAVSIRAHDELARRLNEMEGHDGAWVVPLWRDRVPTVDEILAEAAEFPQTLRPKDPPTQAVWSELWRLSLGLMDGSPLPAGLDAEALQHDGKQLLVTLPGAIVPDPSPLLAPTGTDADPRVCDPLRELTADPPGDPGLEAPASPANRRRAADERTLVWKIGARIAEDLQTAIREGAPVEPPSAEQAARPDEGEATGQAKRDRHRARRRIIHTLGLSTTLAVAATVAAWVKLPLIAALAVTVLAGVGWWWELGRLALRLIYRRQQAEFEPLRRAMMALNAAIKGAVRAGDGERLRRRYAEYLDWAEVIGWIAHHPWVGEPLQRVAMPAAIDPARLPAAFSVGVAVDEQRVGELAEVLRDGSTRGRRIFTPEWLTGLFDTVRHTLTDRADGRPSNPSPEADRGDDPSSPRRRLLRGVRAGVGRHLAVNPLAQELMIYVEGLEIDELATAIAPMRLGGSGSRDALPPAVTWLTPPSNLSHLTARLRPLVVRVDVETLAGTFGGSGVVVGSGGLIATARHVVEGAERIVVRFLDGRVTPAEIHRLAPWTDLALISVVDAYAGEAAELAADDSVEQGDPVISLGHPALMDGEPSFAWGLVTATRRRIEIDAPPAGIGRFDVIQATYQSAGGASGSPVFNLQGEVVGIHSAAGDSHVRRASRVPEHISSAVPVADLHTLLAAAAGGPPRPAPIAAESRAGSWLASPEPTLPTPSAFMTVEGDNPFLGDHWRDLSSDPHVTIRSLVSGGVSSRVKDLAGECSFFAPIRVTRSVVQLAGSTTAEALAGCQSTSATRSSDPDHAAGVRDAPAELDEVG